MHRFYLTPEECRRTTLTLTGREAHHAAQVLRVRPGEVVTVLDGVGHEFLCAVQNVSRQAVSLLVQETKFTPPLPHRITLLQAIPKGKLMESIIQKATELGVARIIPLLSERVTTQLDEEGAADKQEKWQHTKIEAVKQCGQTWLPAVEKPVSLKDFLAQNERFDLPLVASLQNGSQHPKAVFQNFVEMNQRKPNSACIWVGPEGDLSPAEMTLIQSAGALPITLGRLVLRCETAAVYCLSVLNHELTA